MKSVSVVCNLPSWLAQPMGFVSVVWCCGRCIIPSIYDVLYLFFGNLPMALVMLACRNVHSFPTLYCLCFYMHIGMCEMYP
jgi:hypothetical protein